MHCICVGGRGGGGGGVGGGLGSQAILDNDDMWPVDLAGAEPCQGSSSLSMQMQLGSRS